MYHCLLFLLWLSWPEGILLRSNLIIRSLKNDGKLRLKLCVIGDVVFNHMLVPLMEENWKGLGNEPSLLKKVILSLVVFCPLQPHVPIDCCWTGSLCTSSQEFSSLLVKQTLPPRIMVQWKTGPSNTGYLSNTAIFHWSMIMGERVKPSMNIQFQHLSNLDFGPFSTSFKPSLLPPHTTSPTTNHQTHPPFFWGGPDLFGLVASSRWLVCVMSGNKLNEILVTWILTNGWSLESIFEQKNPVKRPLLRGEINNLSFPHWFIRIYNKAIYKDY